ncbi:MAG TPA: FHA domain-containing protein, partial [Steroidobacteraceae bacterium]
MTLTSTITAGMNDWLSHLATRRKALLGRGAKRFATLVSPHAELEEIGAVEQGDAPVVTLTVMSGLHRGASMVLRSGAYLLGSGPDCDISLRDRAIRSHHCRLTREWFGFSILELGEENARQIA